MQEKKKTKTNKLYQNCSKCFGCLAGEFAGGNDAQLVNKSCKNSFVYVFSWQILIFQPDILTLGSAVFAFQRLLGDEAKTAWSNNENKTYF